MPIPTPPGPAAPPFSGGDTGLCFHAWDGWYVLNDVTLCSGAVWLPDLWALFLGADKRGTNTPKPHAPGVIANPMRWTQTDYDLPILVSGEIDVSTGAPWASAPPSDSAAFERNLLWLRRNLGIDPDGTITVTSHLYTADGLDAPADVQPLRLTKDSIIEADSETGHGLHLIGKLRVRYPGGGPIFPTGP